MARSRASAAEGRHDDRGTSLILVLVFLVAVGFLFIVLGGAAASDLTNSGNLTSQRSVEYAASGATNMAVQTVRYSGQQYATSADCLPNGSSVTINGRAVFVDCVQQSFSALSGVTRVINFFTCTVSTAIPVGASTCTSADALVSALVTYDDYDSTNHYHCIPGGLLSSCGSSMTVSSWVVQSVNN